MYRTVFFNHVGNSDEPASIALPRWSDFQTLEDAQGKMVTTINDYLHAGWQLFTGNMVVNGLTGQQYRAVECHVVNLGEVK